MTVHPNLANLPTPMIVAKYHECHSRKIKREMKIQLNNTRQCDLWEVGLIFIWFKIHIHQESVPSYGGSLPT